MKTKEEIINDLLGSTCWRPWRGFGSAIFFEFGDRFPYRKGGKLRRGTYTIGLSCPWQVFRNKKAIFDGSIDLKKIDQKLSIFKNVQVIQIIFDNDVHEERIVFSNGLEIHTYHYKPYHQWHILTPELECVFFKKKVEVAPIKD